MGNFQRDDRRGGGFRGGNNRGGRPSFRGGPSDRGEVTMHKAVCDECHKECEVPFRPSGDKPIYCNECFAGKRRDDDRGGRRDFGDRGPKRDFGGRPQESNFAKPAPVSNDTAKQLGEINSKLDRLINAMDKFVQPKVEVKKVPEVKVVAKKAVVAKAPVKAVAKKVVAKKKK